MKKILQFDYFPLLRSSYDANELVTEGLLKDELNVYWNRNNIFKDIQSSKETAEHGFIKRTVDIDLLDENKLVLDNTQTWHNEESIKLNAEINLNRKKEDVWNLQFLYNLTTTNNDDYQSFNEKFGILDEMFHFKLNGEALLVNEKVEGGRRIFAEKEFLYTNPSAYTIEGQSKMHVVYLNKHHLHHNTHKHHHISNHDEQYPHQFYDVDNICLETKRQHLHRAF